MHTAQRVGQAVAGGAGCDVIGVQGTARAAAGSNGEVLLAVLDGPLLWCLQPGAGSGRVVELPVMEHWTSSFFMMATPP